RGGLFSSSLLLGGVYGGAAVVVLHGALSALGVADGEFDRAAYMLVGMAAVGVMVGVIIASVVVRLTFGYSFATWRFHLRGVPIRSGYDIGWIQDLTVGRLMRKDVHTVPSGTSIAEFRARFPLGGHKRVFVVD